MQCAIILYTHLHAAGSVQIGFPDILGRKTPGATETQALADQLNF